ncbi:MAG: c-type cytochrome [Burkholderiaceae bacterium]
MSDQHNQSLIKTPKQLIVTIVAAFLVPIVIIVLLVGYVTSARKTGAGSEGMTAEATEARVAPVAKFELVDTNAPRELKAGKDVYGAVCTTCHGAGIAGAPKFGDAAAWGPRIAQGAATLYEHAIKGYQGKAGVMPAKGGNTDLDDVEVERAVVYMANAGGAKFPEPAAPEKAAVAAAPAAPALPQADPAVVAAIAAINAGTKGTTPAAPAAATTVALATPAAAGDNGAGKKLYDSVCMVCHAGGIAGAPKFGDKAAWAPRIAQGLDTLYQHAINGYQGKNGVMPAKGGSNAPDDDVKAAVRYITDAAK